MAEGREFSGELRLIRYNDDEFGSRALRFIREQRRGDNSPREWHVAEFRLQAKVEPACSILRACLRIFGFRISPLQDPVRHHTVKNRPIVEALLCEVNEVPYVMRCLIRIELDDEISSCGIKDGLKLFGVVLRGQQQGYD